MNTTALVLAIILFIAGLVGTILPILPGGILIYAGMLLYGFMTQFTTLDLNFFLIQGVVLAFLFFVDYFASALGTRHFGGSKQAAWGAITGTILGVIFLGPLGIVLGPFIGAVGAELIRGAAVKKAFSVGVGTLIGILGGTVIKIGTEVAMIIYFFIRI